MSDQGTSANEGADSAAKPAIVPARDAWFLTGPTASGKSAIGLELAAALNAEILSLDSMAVYRGLDLGTAKPSAAQQQRVPHHLIDLVDPAEDFSLAQYLAAAHQAISEIRARGRVPLFVGGTPLYLTSLLRGVESGPPPDWEFRRKWHDLAATAGNEAVHRRLQEIDPVTAERLHPGNLRRVIRAIEIFETTGRPMSETPEHFARPVPQAECRVFSLGWPRELLNDRINARVDQMLAAGWVEEVRRLQEQGPLGRTAKQAVGYRQILEHLESGRPLADVRDEVKTATRRFAKRQRTWFRSLGECRAVVMNVDRTPAGIVAEILAAAAEI